MKLIDRLNESPSMRKLLHNRGALIALSIISLYILLFVWITGMQLVGWVGNATGSFDLRKRPVMGALLPERTLELIGAGNLPGFGLTAEPEKRTEQVKFFFDQAQKLFNEYEQSQNQAAASSTGSSSANAPQSLDALKRSMSLAERHIADLPIEDLHAIFDRGMVVFAQQDELRRLRPKIVKIDIAIEKLEHYRAQIEKSPTRTGEDFENLCEDAGFTLEDLVNLIHEYGQLVRDKDDPLVAINTDTLSDSVDALLDYEPATTIFDLGVMGQIQSGVDLADQSIDHQINAKLDELEPVLLELYPSPTGIEGWIYKFRLMLGTDQQGRSIMLRALYSAKIAIQVGIIVSFIAVCFGSIIGAAAGYFGGIVDHVVIWLYSTFSSIPYLVLLVVLAFMFSGSALERTLVPLYVAFSLTFWIGPCRVTRGEALKLKNLDYVQAAQAIGASRWRILLRHILPNTAHLMFINSSLLFIGAIKGEVVLTFLGLGLKKGVSWGTMISQSQSEIVSGFFWQIGAATFFMFVLVLAFNILTDALQDAFDPKYVG